MISFTPWTTEARLNATDMGTHVSLSVVWRYKSITAALHITFLCLQAGSYARTGLSANTKNLSHAHANIVPGLSKLPNGPI